MSGAGAWVTQEIVADAIGPFADGYAGRTESGRFLIGRNQDVVKVGDCAMGRHRLHPAGFRVHHADPGQYEPPPFDGDPTEVLEQGIAVGSTHDGLVGLAQNRVQPVQAENFFLGDFPFGYFYLEDVDSACQFLRPLRDTKFQFVVGRYEMPQTTLSGNSHSVFAPALWSGKAGTAPTPGG